MLTRNTKHIEVVVGNSAEEFQAKLNTLFLSLAEDGVKFDLQTNVATGFVAYIIYDIVEEIPETIREQFEEGEEKHTCIECPYFVRPFDGRRKYTKCPKCNRVTKADNFCCDAFYEELFDGAIELIEIG